jgi:hypothetical protein
MTILAVGARIKMTRPGLLRIHPDDILGMQRNAPDAASVAISAAYS